VGFQDWRPRIVIQVQGALTSCKAALLGQGQHAAAEPLLLSGYEEGLEKTEPTIPPQGKYNLRDALERLVQLYTAWDKPAEAEKWRAKLEEMKSDEKN